MGLRLIKPAEALLFSTGADKDLGFAILACMDCTSNRLRGNVFFILSVASHSGSPERGPALPPPGTEKS